jgi:ribosome-associated protein
MRIPDSEIRFLFSRSSGKGGQNVNKTSSKAEAIWDFLNSSVLNDEEKQMILDRLKLKLNAESCLHAVAEAERSQLKNRQLAIAKLNAWVNEALKKRRRRKKTNIPKAVKEKNKNSKIKASEKKKSRGERF